MVVEEIKKQIELNDQQDSRKHSFNCVITLSRNTDHPQKCVLLISIYFLYCCYVAQHCNGISTCSSFIYIM